MRKANKRITICDKNINLAALLPTDSDKSLDNEYIICYNYMPNAAQSRIFPRFRVCMTHIHSLPRAVREPPGTDICEGMNRMAKRREKMIYERFVKRALDVFISGLALVLLALPMLIVAIWIRCEDPGPSVFRQKRVGRGKKLFVLYKFRSMRMDAPHDTPTHLLRDPARYILRVGRFIRKTSIDELPQLWNIFKGDMSLIGPRPALWNQDDLIAARDACGANGVRPGLTGWAQINGRDEIDNSEKARLDGEYVASLGFRMDIRCFFGTIASVVKQEGIAEGERRAASTERECSEDQPESAAQIEVLKGENKL